MRGTIYCYYDKTLVTNCRLRVLEPFIGTVARDSVIQMLVYPLGTENAPLSAPTGISADGDFYLVANTKDVIYQIHRSGRLLRVYTSGVSLVEETILVEPMSALAVLQGRILLHGTILTSQGNSVIVVGEAAAWKRHGMAGRDMILVSEGTEGYGAIMYSNGGRKEGRAAECVTFPKVEGILVLGHGGADLGTEPIESVEAKKALLGKHVVGMGELPQILREQLTESGVLERICEGLPMNVWVPGNT